MIRETGGARKLCVALPGGGKSGGVRVIYVGDAVMFPLAEARSGGESDGGRSYFG